MRFTQPIPLYFLENTGFIPLFYFLVNTGTIPLYFFRKIDLIICKLAYLFLNLHYNQPYSFYRLNAPLLRIFINSLYSIPEL